jgi:carbon storage regulator
LGIEAPKEKKIYRQEIYDRICQENQAASQWNLEKLDALQAALPAGKESE